jgi:hypothetical protein
VNPFDVWLIIVGLAIGAGLAWLVMLDLRRRDDDIAAGESRAEAAWIADTLRSREIAADAEAVEEVLRLHRAYLAGIPDDGALHPAHVPTFADGTDETYDDDVGADIAPARATAPVAPAAPRTAAAAPPRSAPPIVPAPDPGEAPAPEAPEVEGDALEPPWADEDLAAAHDALDALLQKPPPAG